MMDNRIRSKPCRRAVRRNPADAAITCRPYFSYGANQTVEGILRNFSTTGLYVETQRQFGPGTILILRMLRYPSVLSVLDGGNRTWTICLAEVKWRRELAAKDEERYGMGLQCLD